MSWAEEQFDGEAEEESLKGNLLAMVLLLQQ